MSCKIRVLSYIQDEYGAVMRGKNSILPITPFFLSEPATRMYHGTLDLVAVESGHLGHQIKLQKPAANALLAARTELEAETGIRLTVGRHQSGLRSFSDTLEIWNRNQPDLHCDGPDCLAMACNLSKEVFLDRIRSTALPGTSQHHLGIAVDIDQWSSKKVREVLAKHGFHRTVYADRPHFTYLGVSDPETLGLFQKHGYWSVINMKN